MKPSTTSVLRFTVIVLGLIELVPLLAFIGLMAQSTDPLGKAIGDGMIQRAVLPLAMVVAALVLGALNRGLRTALGFIVLALIAFATLWTLA